MQIIKADVFSSEILSQADAVGFTSNGMIKHDGRAVMGAGNALMAARIWPELPRLLGVRLRNHGNHLYLLHKDRTAVNKRQRALEIFNFPTKQDWKQPASLKLIEASAKRLVRLTEQQNYQAVYLPAPGIGHGSLAWWQVSKILAPLLDERFFICFLPK